MLGNLLTTKLITMLFALEVGFMPLNAWVANGETVGQNKSNTYYTELDSEIVVADHFFIGGSVTTMLSPFDIEGGSFSVYGSTYEFETGIRINKFELGFRHVCGPHPVNSYPSFDSNWESPSPFEGSYEQVYLRFEGKVK